MTTIRQIVTDALVNANESHLTDIVAHGIHNVTNAYQGETDAEYDEFAAEFESQAAALLAAIESAR